MQYSRQNGFSLIELSIVILIMGLLLGGLMMPLSVQRENAKVREGLDILETARSAVEGFALVNGFLPCPATPASSGVADTIAGACVVRHGFLPATTMNLNGLRNTDNLLLDPWGAAIRYSVSGSDADSDGNWDFVTAGEMRDVTLPNLTPDLVVCSTASGSTAIDCAAASVTLTLSAPAVVYSIGKDWSSFSSPDQVENVGATLGGGASGVSYRVAADNVFVARGSSALSGSEFDDLVIWLSPNQLYARMVDAGYLP